MFLFISDLSSEFLCTPQKALFFGVWFRITKPFVTKKWPGTFKKVVLDLESLANPVEIIHILVDPWLSLCCIGFEHFFDGEVFGESCVIGLTETGKAG